jgi:hypothetical protein
MMMDVTLDAIDGETGGFPDIGNMVTHLNNNKINKVNK